MSFFFFIFFFFFTYFFYFSFFFFFFSSRRRHTRWTGDWSSDVCSSDLNPELKCQSSSFPPASRPFTSIGARVNDFAEERTCTSASIQIDSPYGDQDRKSVV